MSAPAQRACLEVQAPTPGTQHSVGHAGGHGDHSQLPGLDASRDALEISFFTLGMRIGAALQGLFICALVMCVSNDRDSGAIVELSQRYYAVFRWLLVVPLFFVCYGVCLLVWHRFRINYHAILSVSQEHTYQYMIRASTSFMLVLFPTFILYISCLLTSEETMKMRKFVPPLIAIIASLLFFLLPVGAGVGQRYGLIRIIILGCCSPFTQVDFGRVFVADVLTSMPKVFADAEYTACLYVSGEAFASDWNRTTFQYETDGVCEQDDGMLRYIIKIVLSVLPFYIRFMQCMRALKDTHSPRQAVNAFKHFSSIMVACLSLRSDIYPWLAAAVFSTLFGFAWDILIDWGLGPASIRRALHGEAFGHPCPSSRLLRPICLYPRWVYYVAVCSNLITKFGWSIVVSPGQTVMKQHVVLLLSCVEVIRRAQWAMVKLEWEDVQRTFGKEPVRMSPERSDAARRHTILM